MTHRSYFNASLGAFCLKVKIKFYLLNDLAFRSVLEKESIVVKMTFLHRESFRGHRAYRQERHTPLFSLYHTHSSVFGWRQKRERERKVKKKFFENIACLSRFLSFSFSFSFSFSLFSSFFLNSCYRSIT